jgi:hypothetical protein
LTVVAADAQDETGAGTLEGDGRAAAVRAALADFDPA